jgi:hypothetical protein
MSTKLKILAETIRKMAVKVPNLIFWSAPAGRRFSGPAGWPHPGWRDVSRLLKAATRRRTPKAYV